MFSAPVACLFCFLAGPNFARAQAPVSTITLGRDQIGTVRTAQGITTRISFGEDVAEIICGDLYDPASGKGGFVVQRSGADVFVKPIPSKGMSNLFVKTGEGGKHTFNFDLLIVPVAQANRVVNIIGPSAGGPASPSGPEDAGASAPGGAAQNRPSPDTPLNQRGSDRDGSGGTQTIERRKAEIEQLARQEADEIVRTARQQASRMLAEADARVADADKQVADRAERETESRFLRQLMLGLRETRIANPRVVIKKVIITLDPRVLTFGEKSYLRYTIQNTSDKPFSFSAISLEAAAGSATQSIPIEVAQSKPENEVAPGESLAGVITFGPKLPAPKDRLTLYLRGEDNVDIARLVIQ